MVEDAALKAFPQDTACHGVRTNETQHELDKHQHRHDGLQPSNYSPTRKWSPILPAAPPTTNYVYAYICSPLVGNCFLSPTNGEQFIVHGGGALFGRSAAGHPRSRT